MKTNQAITNRTHPDGTQYALRRQADSWEVTFQGRQATFNHELGALYIAYLLLHPSREPLHGVALALNARDSLGQPPTPDEAQQQLLMGLEDAASVRVLWRRQCELERVLADRLEIDPVKAEALLELEDVTERLRRSPWLSRHSAERCARAVGDAIKRLHARLAAAVDAAGKPDVVLRAFALHLHAHLLLPSGRGGSHSRAGAWSLPGCFIYVPPSGLVWNASDASLQAPPSSVQCSAVPGSAVHRPAAVEYLSSFLSAGLALALLVTGCAGPRPLKGGKAVTTHGPAGVTAQTLTQGENPSQATKQSQETVKVRTYTLPPGSRFEQSQAPAAPTQPSTLNSQPSTAFTLSAPMPVVEREETRAATELGAAQKDTARELGARLASLKGVVWVGVGLFVFGLASLVYPPLKLLIGSVTTSAALLLGGVSLMVLPSLIVGNELLILGGVVVAVGAWFLAHRHGHLRGIVSATAAPQTTAPTTDH